MSQELLAKVRADLERSGMHTEMLARQIFHRAGWSMSGGAAYLDRDEGKSRELDISAARVSNLELKGTSLGYNEMRIVAEVKKSERPWIVFKRPPPTYQVGCAWNNLISSINLPCEPHELARFLETGSLLMENGWEGVGIHEAFKNPDQPSRWYGAFVAVCKAAEAHLDDHSPDGERLSPDIATEPTEITFHQPLVILDGALITAELSPDNEIVLAAAQSAAFKFDYRTPVYKRGPYRVDLVTLAGLEAYLDLQVTRQESINDGLIAKTTSVTLTRARDRHG